MIHINEGQAQLSGWGYSAEPEALFINKVPEPFMVGQTISAEATRDRGGTSLKFKDGTILHYRMGYGLFPPLTDVTVWTVPAEGTTVSNTLEYVEIHASYTTKKGKVIQAIPAKIPVAVPKFLRVIVPEEPLIDEGEYLQTDRQWGDVSQYRGIESACNIKGVRFFVYWADSHDTIIKSTEVFDSSDNPLIHSAPFTQGTNTGTYEGPYLYAPESTNSATFTRYRSETDEGTEITLENAMRFIFRHKIGNVTLQAETYFQNNPVVSWGFFNLRTSYAGETQYTVNIQNNSKVKFKDGKVQTGQYGQNRFWLPIWLRYLTIGGWYEYREEQTITLDDGRHGVLWEYCFSTMRDSSSIAKVMTRYYKCEDGTVEWTATQPW